MNRSDDAIPAQKRVLVVDDDADIRTNFCDILSALGYVTETAADAEIALQMIAAEPFDVALLDYKLPGMNGVELYQQIKKVRPELATIIVSAHGGQQGAERAREAGAWDVLRKPVDMLQLLDTVKQATEAPMVLLVDDDVEFCQSLWQILNDRHFRVALAHNESDGIRLGMEAGCQIALIDLQLGSGDGRNVVRECQRVNRRVRTVLITGHRENAVEDEELKRVFDAVVYKPVAV